MRLPKGSIMLWRRAVLQSVDSGGGFTTEVRTYDTWADLMDLTAVRSDEPLVIPSEHSRAPLEISIERIGESNRMYNGRMRKYVVGDKKTFSTSWSLLPYDSSATVDKKAGINDMQDFYDNTQGYFILTVVPGDAFKGGVETYTDINGIEQQVSAPELTMLSHYQVVFTDFNPSISKRVASDKGDLSVSIEEV